LALLAETAKKKRIQNSEGRRQKAEGRRQKRTEERREYRNLTTDCTDSTD